MFLKLKFGNLKGNRERMTISRNFGTDIAPNTEGLLAKFQPTLSFSLSLIVIHDGLALHLRRKFILISQNVDSIARILPWSGGRYLERNV